MPEVDFFLNEKDRNTVIEYAFKLGCQVVPGTNYRSNQYVTITDPSSFERECGTVPLLHLIHPGFSKYALQLDRAKNSAGDFWFIKQRHGGPTIDFYSPIVGEKKNKILGPGFISIYEFYYNGDKTIVPNSELIDTYKLIVSFIQSFSKKAKLTRRTFWVGPHALELSLNGQISLLPIDGIEIKDVING